jgi:signal transduction histidine kinase
VVRRIDSLKRGWLAPMVFVAIAAALTIPWAYWVLRAAHQRDISEKADRLAERVKIQVAAASWEWPLARNWNHPQQLLKPLEAELLGDETVQAVAFLDDSRNIGGFVRRNDAIPIPRTRAEAERMLEADSNSFRRIFPWEHRGKQRGLIYLDLSNAQLERHFWRIEGPLFWRVGIQTVVAFMVVSLVGIFAFRLWGTATRQRELAELEQRPLAALRFQLHSLRRRAEDPQRVVGTADTIDSELSRIQELVQEYLAHEKAQSFRVEPVDVTSAVRALQDLMGELLREHGTRLNIIERSPGVTVMCDPHALRQVLMNLVINAQQAMGRGGAIAISIDQSEGFGTIAVSDTGPGIPEEMKDRLFKPFATSKKEGSGIGLALVKRFVDNFGGSVGVASEPGHGATFTLRLPLAGSESAGLVLQYEGKERPAMG